MLAPTSLALFRQARRMQKELARRLKKTGVLRHFRFRLIAAEPGRVLVSFRVAPRHLQVLGVVHGGVIGTLADTAGGLATYMAAPAGTRVATVEMKINFLEPVERGTVTADARVIRCGRNFSVVDCDVKDASGRLLGKALMTFAIGPAQDAEATPARRRGAQSRARRNRRIARPRK